MVWQRIQAEKPVEREEEKPAHGSIIGSEEQQQTLEKLPATPAPDIVDIHGVVNIESAVQPGQDKVAEIKQHHQRAEKKPAFIPQAGNHRDSIIRGGGPRQMLFL